jgi:hypothetical protein
MDPKDRIKREEEKLYPAFWLIYDRIKSSSFEIFFSRKLVNHPIINKCMELGISHVNLYIDTFKKMRSSRKSALKTKFVQDYIRTNRYSSNSSPNFSCAFSVMKR